MIRFCQTKVQCFVETSKYFSCCFIVNHSLQCVFKGCPLISQSILLASGAFNCVPFNREMFSILTEICLQNGPSKSFIWRKIIGREDAKQEIIWESSAVFSAITMLLSAQKFHFGGQFACGCTQKACQLVIKSNAFVLKKRRKSIYNNLLSS